MTSFDDIMLQNEKLSNFTIVVKW